MPETSASTPIPGGSDDGSDPEVPDDPPTAPAEWEKVDRVLQELGHHVSKGDLTSRHWLSLIAHTKFGIKLTVLSTAIGVVVAAFSLGGFLMNWWDGSGGSTKTETSSANNQTPDKRQDAEISEVHFASKVPHPFLNPFRFELDYQKGKPKAPSGKTLFLRVQLRQSTAALILIPDDGYEFKKGYAFRRREIEGHELYEELTYERYGDAESSKKRIATADSQDGDELILLLRFTREAATLPNTAEDFRQLFEMKEDKS